MRSIVAKDRYRGCSFVSDLVQGVAGLQVSETARVAYWSIETKS